MHDSGVGVRIQEEFSNRGGSIFLTRKYSLSRRDFKDPGSDTELGNYYFIR